MPPSHVNGSGLFPIFETGKIWFTGNAFVLMNQLPSVTEVFNSISFECLHPRRPRQQVGMTRYFWTKVYLKSITLTEPVSEGFLLYGCVSQGLGTTEFRNLIG